MKKYTEIIEKYCKKNIMEWNDKISNEQLFNCLFACSNASFFDEGIHREKIYNIYEYLLSETQSNLYESSTYGVQPATLCYEEIGSITGRKYGNFEIAMFLIDLRRKELKKWLLNNHKFDKREKKVLKYFKQGKGEL